MQERTDVTEILLKWTDGDSDALDRLMPIVYDQLKRLAHARLQHERSDHTLNTTALVHEAYVKLINANQVNWRDRVHFFALASRVMRRLLVDYAKRRNAIKRGGAHRHVTLQEEMLMPDEDAGNVLELNEWLVELEKQYPRQANAIEHKYFGGLTNVEIAAVQGTSHATVERDLRFARTWLAHHLDRESAVG
jgi:RNA polymerase sigma factor (TIGR02999 family)